MKYILVLLSIISCNVFAAKWATVTSKKAIIYADREMTSSIGYIKKGKRVRVGEKTRRGGKLLPIVVRKKIAYIKVSDINSSVKLTQLESASQRIKDVQIKSDETRISAFYSGYASLISIKQSESFANDTYEDSLFYFNGFGVRGYLSKSNSKKTWRMSLESASTLTEKNKISFIALTPEISFDFIEFTNYSFRGYIGLPIVPFAQYSYDGLFTVNGYGLGASAGAEMEFKLKNSFGLHFDAGYQFLKLFYRLPSDAGIDEFNPVFNGARFSAAISYAY